LGNGHLPSDEPAKCLTPAELEKEANDKFMLVTMHKLLLVTLAYNRALSEINNSIVEDRYSILKQILEAAKNQGRLSLKFCVYDLIRSSLSISTDVVGKYHRGSVVSSKSPFRKQYPQFNTSDGTLFEVLCEVLIPPSVGSRTNTVSRAQSYSASALSHSVSYADNEQVAAGKELNDSSSHDQNNGTRSPKIQFELSREGSFSLNNGNNGNRGNSPSRNPLHPAITPGVINESYRSENFSPELEPAQENGTRDSMDLKLDFGDVPVIDDTADLIGYNDVDVDVDVDFDVNMSEILVNTSDDYEAVITSLHNEVKKQTISYLLEEEKKYVVVNVVCFSFTSSFLFIGMRRKSKYFFQWYEHYLVFVITVRRNILKQ
jgi:hypothetical protein